MPIDSRKWVLTQPPPQWLIDLAATEGGDRFIDGWRTNLPREDVRVVDFEFEGETPVRVGFDSALWQSVDRGSVDSALQDLLAELRRRAKRRASDEQRQKEAADEMRRRFPSS